MFEENVPQNQAQRVMFYMGVKPDKAASAKEGRPIFVEVPFIKIFTAGDSLTIIDKPVWDDANNPNSHTQRFPKEWLAFKAGVAAEDQQGGTPLKLMPGISQAQVRELEHFHVRTVEQLADIADAHASKFMGIQALKQEARAYLLRAKGGAADKALQRELAARDQEIELLKAQMKQLLEEKATKPLLDAPEMPTGTPESSKPKAKRAKAAA